MKHPTQWWFVFVKEGPVSLADGQTTFAKTTKQTRKISGVAPFFSSAPEMDENNYWRNFTKTERTWVLYSGDVHKKKIADES
jgi:hypothetical protein